MTIKLILGLQNPGTAYAQTRHNAGAWFAEAIAKYFTTSFKPEKKLHASVANIERNNQVCKIALPTTFMNQSGLPARAISQFYRILPEEILVVHDELDLTAGRIKLKTDGGHGGHNGLRDITPHIGNDFHRLRVGIGHPGHKSKVSGHVLSKASPDEQIAIDSALSAAFDALPLLLDGDIEKARSQINGFKVPE